MAENLCKGCTGACCKGPLTMSLSVEEHAMMEEAGTDLFTLEEPVDYDRDAVPYPVGHEINSRKGTKRTLYEKGRETEPLKAGVGLYLMLGACGNLQEVEGVEQCSIYEERPQVCRDFPLGKPACVLMKALGHGGFLIYDVGAS